MIPYFLKKFSIFKMSKLFTALVSTKFIVLQSTLKVAKPWDL